MFYSPPYKHGGHIFMARNRSCYRQKKEYMNELFHHIFLFFGIVKYTMTRNTLWKRVSITKFPWGTKCYRIYNHIHCIKYLFCIYQNTLLLKKAYSFVSATRQTIYLIPAQWENASTYKSASEAFSPTQRSNRKQSEQKQVPRGRASASTASEYTQQGNSKRRGLCMIFVSIIVLICRHVK